MYVCMYVCKSKSIISFKMKKSHHITIPTRKKQKIWGDGDDENGKTDGKEKG
jgi:hypothetical protein